jgi:ABC-2 type transport system permease protein
MWDGSIAKRMAQTVAIMSLGQVGYCSLFGCLGVLTRRTLIAGVVYIVVFEGLLANLQFMIRSLTVVYYVRVLAIRWLDLPQQVLNRWQSDWGLNLDQIPDANSCVLKLLGFGVSITVLAALGFSRREFRMKTPEASKPLTTCWRKVPACCDQLSARNRPKGHRFMLTRIRVLFSIFC